MTSERKSHDASNLSMLQTTLGPRAGLLFSLLFAFGGMLVIVFHFFPLIDHAKILRRKAEITAGDRKAKDEDGKFDEKIKARKLEGTEADEERKKQADAREKWETERAKLQLSLEDLQVGGEASTYYYAWGAMLGFICLAFAGLGYLNFGQTTSVRVAGAVVVIGEVLFILASYVFPNVGK